MYNGTERGRERGARGHTHTHTHAHTHAHTHHRKCMNTYTRTYTQGMKRSVDQARADGIVPKGLVVINPGNPVGSVLSYEDLTQLVIFCKKEGLMLMADEVCLPSPGR